MVKQVKFARLFLIFFAILFSFGVYFQAWGPETSCSNQGTPQEKCKTEQVDFWHTSAEEFVRFGNGAGDVTNYLKVAKFFVGTFPLDSQVIWNLSNWPPGVPALFAIVLKLTGEEHYFPKLLALTCTVLALFVAGMFVMLNPTSIIQKAITGLLLVLPFAIFPDLRYNTLRFGYIASEGLSLGFFLLAILSLVLFFRRQTVYMAAISGLALALTSYMRASLETVINLTLLAFLGLLVLLMIVQWVGDSNLSLRNKFRSFFLKFLIVVGTYHALVIPWKTRNLIYHNSFSFCATTNFIFSLHWKNSADLPPWIPDTNVPCQIDSELCKSIQKLPEEFTSQIKKELSVSYFLKNIPSWYSVRIKYFNRLWNNGVSYLPSGMPDLTWLQYWFESLVSLALFGVGIVIFLRKNRGKLTETSLDYLFLFSLSFILANIALFTFASYEGRYSLHLRFFLMLFGVFSIFWPRLRPIGN